MFKKLLKIALMILAERSGMKRGHDRNGYRGEKGRSYDKRYDRRYRTDTSSFPKSGIKGMIAKAILSKMFKR